MLLLLGHVLALGGRAIFVKMEGMQCPSIASVYRPRVSDISRSRRRASIELFQWSCRTSYIRQLRDLCLGVVRPHAVEVLASIPKCYYWDIQKKPSARILQGRSSVVCYYLLIQKKGLSQQGLASRTWWVGRCAGKDIHRRRVPYLSWAWVLKAIAR